MKNEARQKTVEPNSQREAGKRARQSAQKSAPGEAPLKEHGQPAWRNVKRD
jgi:hypothetical protein